MTSHARQGAAADSEDNAEVTRVTQPLGATLPPIASPPAVTTPARGRALLVASTGGHLEQLTRLAPRLSPAFEAMDYATFDDLQSRSLLDGRRVHYVERIAPRDLATAGRVAAPALRILRQGGYDAVVSTGSAIAVPFALAARTLGREMHYIESSARSDGPSLTGRILARVPGVRLYSQYHGWSSQRWQYRGSVFDGFDLAPEARPDRPIGRVVVTLGTMRGFPFRRAVMAVQSLLSQVADPTVDVLWQVGDTPTEDLGIRGVELIPAREMGEAIGAADLVIGHAGIGTCLQMLDQGHCPVILPRASRHGEHIDDHQWLIARELEARGLAVSRDPDELTVDDALLAMSRRVVRPPLSDPFRLSRRPSCRSRHA